MSDSKSVATAAGGEIHVTVPASVLNDLEAFQRVQAEILGKSGCLTCTSGYHLIWHTYSEFAVDEDGHVEAIAVNPQPIPVYKADNPEPSPWIRADADR
jgi:hypothetical protein